MQHSTQKEKFHQPADLGTILDQKVGTVLEKNFLARFLPKKFLGMILARDRLRGGCAWARRGWVVLRFRPRENVGDNLSIKHTSENKFLCFVSYLLKNCDRKKSCQAKK